MAQLVEVNCKSIEADGAIAQYARVHFEADGKIVAAGIADLDIGVAEREAFAAADIISVRLNSAAGTRKYIASAALSVGDLVYTAASGKVGASASTAYLIGRALTASAADGDIIEVTPVHTGAAVA